MFGFVTDTAQNNTAGIGLGLTIADQIVNEFNGKITFDSVPEEGSNFVFTIQLANLHETHERHMKTLQDKYQLNSSHLVFDWQPEFRINSFLEKPFIQYIH